LGVEGGRERRVIEEEVVYLVDPQARGGENLIQRQRERP
jgi:hypothetical protein